LLALAEVPAVLALLLMVGDVVDHLAFGVPLHMVCHGVRYARDPQASWVPAVPAQVEILRAASVVALKGSQRQSFAREKRATKATPVGRDERSAADARIGKVHPASAPPAMLGRDLPDVARRRALLHSLKEAAHALAFLLAYLGILAVFKPITAGLERHGEPWWQCPFGLGEVLGNGVLWRTEAS